MMSSLQHKSAPSRTSLLSVEIVEMCWVLANFSTYWSVHTGQNSFSVPFSDTFLSLLVKNLVHPKSSMSTIYKLKISQCSLHLYIFTTAFLLSEQTARDCTAHATRPHSLLICFDAFWRFVKAKNVYKRGCQIKARKFKQRIVAWIHVHHVYGLPEQVFNLYLLNIETQVCTILWPL